VVMSWNGRNSEYLNWKVDDYAKDGVGIELMEDS